MRKEFIPPSPGDRVRVVAGAVEPFEGTVKSVRPSHYVEGALQVIVKHDDGVASFYWRGDGRDSVEVI